MPTEPKNINPIIKINLQQNIQFCFNSGFGTLITENNDEKCRNSIIFIHNGVELLMKYYLKKQNKLLIFYKNITPHFLLNERDDLKKAIDLKKAKANTITYNECRDILEFFSHLPNRDSVYLRKLNNQRNDCVHYQYSYIEKELRRLLISHIYQFICDLIFEMELDIKDFISEDIILSMNNLKDTIDKEIEHSCQIKIEAAKNHYYKELTEVDRDQKADSEDYVKRKFDKIVKCPACENNSLLRKVIQHDGELFIDQVAIKRKLILKDLSCHYCGLNITDYDQLKLKFESEERSLPNQILIYPDDCAPDDCAPDDCAPDDCAPDDCAPDDCAPDDCAPDDCAPDDCAPDDCAPDDCAPDDCAPDDCAPDDCAPDDCAPDDCAPDDCAPDDCAPDDCAPDDCAPDDCSYY